MPTHDFENIGEVLDFQILKGKITAIDSAADTCTVDAAGSSREALIFYHCKPDSIIRDNGAIEGGAGGFAVDDEVVVMINSDNSVVKVIGHIDGIRKCSSWAVFTVGLADPYEVFTKTGVLVWDIKQDKAVVWENGTCIDPNDEDYKIWHKSVKIVEGDMLSISKVDDVSPYKIEPSLVDVTSIQYHHNGRNAGLFEDYYLCGWYSTVLFPPKDQENPPPTSYAGFRIMSVDASTGAGYRMGWIADRDGTIIWGGAQPKPSMSFDGQLQEWDGMGFIDDQNDTSLMTFYGLLGINYPLGLFELSGESHREFGDSRLGTSNSGTRTEITIKRPSLTPGKNTYYYDMKYFGQYDANNVAHWTIVQYIPTTISYIVTTDDYDNYVLVESVNGSRIVEIQANAIYSDEGTKEYDITAKGNNAKLVTELKSLVNMVYASNGISGEELRQLGIGIQIMK